MSKLTVVKIGGNVINDEVSLAKVLADFAALKEAKILIHGGGKRASALMRQMGMQPNLVEGRRITDAATLEVVTMVYAGLINKKIVADLQAIGENAIGLTGADLNSIQSHKRIVKTIDYGFVGDIDAIESTNIAKLINADFTPVFCAITHDKKGQLLNTNADSIASRVAVGMSELYDVKLVLCFEKDGVLSDADDDTSVIPQLTYQQFQNYKTAGVIYEGMIPKMEGAFYALQNGVKDVFVAGTTALGKHAVKGTQLI
ncbi:MAG: acetylglutamate kinase [Saprospiraceae bacterium]